MFKTFCLIFLLTCKPEGTVSRSFTMPNLREIKCAIDLNGNMEHLCGDITH